MASQTVQTWQASVRRGCAWLTSDSPAQTQLLQPGLPSSKSYLQSGLVSAWEPLRCCCPLGDCG